MIFMLYISKFIGINKGNLANTDVNRTEKFCICCRILESIEINGHVPAYISLFKVNNRNTRKSREICLKLTPFSSAFILGFEQVMLAGIGMK